MLPPSTRPLRPRCDHCGSGLLHELLRVRIEADGGGAWTLCVDCARAFLLRFEHAHVEAGAILEEAWRLGEAAS